jgi:hypothetical protein
MPPLDETHVQSLVRQLDQAVPRGGTVVVDTADDGGTRVTANRQGYLRLGTELLKAAFAEPRSEVLPDRLDLDLDDLLEQGDIPWTFERREDVDVRPPKSGVDDTGGPGSVLGPAVAFFLLACLAVGAMTILGWVARLFIGSGR